MNGDPSSHVLDSFLTVARRLKAVKMLARSPNYWDDTCADNQSKGVESMGAATARTVYYVVFHEGQWKFEVNDEDHGPFCTRTAAIRAAVDAAHSAGEKGGDAQVLVQRAKNEFRTEWTYGRDPYPPLG